MLYEKKILEFFVSAIINFFCQANCPFLSNFMI